MPERATPGRIAVHIASLAGHYGGAERVMVRLAAGLVERGHAVDFLMTSDPPDPPPQLPAGARVVSLGWPKQGFTSVPRMVGYLRRERPAALITVMTGSNLVALVARALARVPTKVIVNEVTRVSDALRQDHPRRARALTALMRWLYPRAHAIVVNAHGVARDLAPLLGVPLERITVIHVAAVGRELITRAAEPIDDPRFVPGAPPVVTSLGRLAVEKDYPTLLRAFADVRRQRPARLVIFGEGPDRPRLEGLVRELGLAGDVDLPGWASNPFPFIARSAVFVLSSAFEGLPTVVIEALACGTTVVSTDCESGPREILDGGRFGTLVPVGDAPALARGILRALDHPLPRAALQERAMEFSFDRALDRYEALLG